jgi:hypothetical protein
LIYNEQKLEKKINKLCDLYDLKDPVDLFIIVPQEIELAEIRGMINNSSGQEKKEAVISVIMGIASRNKVKINQKWLEVFIDTIVDSSKGKYAINKETK